MKKNILLVILLLATFLSSFYAYLKANEAAYAAEQASVARIEAENLRDEAVLMQEHAQQAAEEARLQHERAEEALRDCQGNK